MIFGREPAAIAAVIAIAINLAISFGLHLTIEQVALINALVVGDPRADRPPGVDACERAAAADRHGRHGSRRRESRASSRARLGSDARARRGQPQGPVPDGAVASGSSRVPPDASALRRGHARRRAATASRPSSITSSRGGSAGRPYPEVAIIVSAPERQDDRAHPADREAAPRWAAGSCTPPRTASCRARSSARSPTSSATAGCCPAPRPRDHARGSRTARRRSSSSTAAATGSSRRRAAELEARPTTT
jgi:hypothetical protein